MSVYECVCVCVCVFPTGRLCFRNTIRGCITVSWCVSRGWSQAPRSPACRGKWQRGGSPFSLGMGLLEMAALRFVRQIDLWGVIRVWGVFCLCVFLPNRAGLGLPWCSSGWDPELPMQRTQVQSLIRELDPTCCNCRSCMPQQRPGLAPNNKIN